MKRPEKQVGKQDRAVLRGKEGKSRALIPRRWPWENRGGSSRLMCRAGTDEALASIGPAHSLPVVAVGSQASEDGPVALARGLPVKKPSPPVRFGLWPRGLRSGSSLT